MKRSPRRWTPAGLSRAAGFRSLRVVADILSSATRSPSVDAIERLARALGCPIEALITDNPEGLPPVEGQRAVPPRDPDAARRVAALRRAELLSSDVTDPQRKHQVVLRALALIYDFMLDREVRGSPLPEDDIEAWRDIDFWIRRDIRENP